MYLSRERVQECLKTICDFNYAGACYLLSYDGLNLEDNFSKMMTENLIKTQEIHLHLQTKSEYYEMLKCSGLGVKIQTLSMLEVYKVFQYMILGLTIKVCCSIVHVLKHLLYNHRFLDDERDKKERIAMLDDVEIWQQIMNHYVVVIGHNEIASNEFNLSF